MEKTYELLRAGGDAAGLEPKLRALFAELPELKMMKPEAARPLLEQQVRMALTPWFRSMLWLDPAAALGKVRCPVLALYGEHDRQVPPRANLSAMAAALSANADVELRTLPRLNHLFQTSETGMVSEYVTLEETMAKVALTTIGDFIVAHTAP